jgi:flagellin-like hook-associated protein FlgL
MTSEQLFGAGGVDYFTPVIEIYNILMFVPETGEIRNPENTLTREEIQQVADLQAIIANNIEKIDNETAMFASRRERIDAVNLQMVEEVVRLKEVNSLKEDVDMPKLLTRLAQEENALQYSLSAGARIHQYSLFKYI